MSKDNVRPGDIFFEPPFSADSITYKALAVGSKIYARPYNAVTEHVYEFSLSDSLEVLQYEEINDAELISLRKYATLRNLIL